jgi:hypothetical protein
MGRRHLPTAITLLVLVGILVVGFLIGTKSLFAPLPGDANPKANPSPTCSPKNVKKGQVIRSAQVQVSVFNGGSQSGLADSTMRKLAARGFTAGDVGNAPSGVTAKRVRVLTTEKNDLAAQLVARQFGSKTKVIVSDTDLGPGVDVVVGNDFDKLSKAKKAIVVKRSSSVCVPLPAETEATTDAG